MLDMSSTSTATGEYSLNVQFNLEKNADIAAVEVQNRVSQANSSMPQDDEGICGNHHVFRTYLA